MSIKGNWKELFVGKQKSTIQNFSGNNEIIEYYDLYRIEYCYFQMGIGGGYLKFIKKDGSENDFNFNRKANEKISMAINLIAEYNPELEIIEHHTTDFKFYQCNWFIAIMLLFCCFPFGLILMWCYKKYDKVTRILLTVFFVTIWGIGIFASYQNYNTFIKESNQVYGTSNSYDFTSNVKAEDVTSEDTESYATTLTAGHYLVGTDIPVGTYSFFSKKGSGNLISDDGSINVIFDHGDALSKGSGFENFGTEELNNIPLNEGTIITVTATQEISAGCSDGLSDNMKSRSQEGLDEIELGYGFYASGDDFPVGTYNIEWLEGTGNIQTDPYDINTGINEIMGELSANGEIDELSEKLCIKQYNNLILKEGTILKINDIKIKLIPSN